MVTLAILALAVAVGACCLGLLLLQQNGRILTRLEAIEQELAERAATGAAPLAKSRIRRDGLSPGEAAPEFRLPRVGGGELSLAEFRGRPTLLVFSDPECAPCNVLAPQLERQSRDTAMQVLMVSRGGEAANDAKRRTLGLTFPIVLQRHWEISRLYAMFATPIAYLIDEHGVIAAPVAKGPHAILGLLSHGASPRAATASG